MAHIVSKQGPGISHHEDHACFKRMAFKKNPVLSFLKGLFTYSNFCPICGEDLREERTITTYYCSECNALILWVDSQFCPNCGVKFDTHSSQNS